MINKSKGLELLGPRQTSVQANWGSSCCPLPSAHLPASLLSLCRKPTTEGEQLTKLGPGSRFGTKGTRTIEAMKRWQPNTAAGELTACVLCLRTHKQSLPRLLLKSCSPLPLRLSPSLGPSCFSASISASFSELWLLLQTLSHLHLSTWNPSFSPEPYLVHWRNGKWEPPMP